MTTAALTDQVDRKIRQREAALAKANRVRVGNARRYHEIAALPKRDAFDAIAVILRGPTGTEPSMQVGALLKAAPHIGDDKVRQLLRRIGAGSPEVRIAALTARQRDVLAGLLDDPRQVWPSYGRGL